MKIMPSILDLPRILAIVISVIFFSTSIVFAQIPNWAWFLSALVFATSDYVITKTITLNDEEKRLLAKVPRKGLSLMEFRNQVTIVLATRGKDPVEVLKEKNVIRVENGRVQLTWLGRIV